MTDMKPKRPSEDILNEKVMHFPRIVAYRTVPVPYRTMRHERIGRGKIVLK